MVELFGQIEPIPTIDGSVEKIPMAVVTGVVPIPSTAKVGQILSVLSVDEEMKLTAVEAIDKPETPSFDLASAGLPAITLDGVPVELETDTTDILAAVSKGAVVFKLNANFGGEVIPANIVGTCLRVNAAEEAATIICPFVLNELGYVLLSVYPQRIEAVYMPHSMIAGSGLPEVSEADNGKVLIVENGKIAFAEISVETETPVFDLANMGLSAVPLSGGFSVMEADTTEIRAALDKGAVEFVIPFGAGETTMQANITMIGANANGAYQCISIVNYTTPGTVTVNIADTMIQVVYAPLDGVPAVGINLSGFESEGKIVETFADGSTATTVMEFDAEGKPTKITDGNGNVTVLTW
jgi:hypothetical protein